MKKHTLYRVIFYVIGLLILAMGIILNTKSGLGVSPFISVAYSVSTIAGINFGNTTFALYAVFVAAEILLHTVQSRRGHLKAKLSLQIGKDLLQLPLSLVFTRFMNLFSAWIPTPEMLSLRFLVLILGIIGTGIGATMSLNTRIIPNLGDGIVQAIADSIHRSVCFTKTTLTFSVSVSQSASA